ncbi:MULTISPECIES: hypothetical protein [Acidiphilium]|nr:MULTISPECIES: hypothetical protein [Acidiphilium]
MIMAAECTDSISETLGDSLIFSLSSFIVLHIEAGVFTMAVEPIAYNVIRFPLELVRPDTRALRQIEPDYFEMDEVVIARNQDGNEPNWVPDYAGEAEAETLPMIEAIDRTDPAAYVAALKKLVADAVAAAVPVCRAWLLIRHEYLARRQRAHANPDSGFFSRMLGDYISRYHHNLEAAYKAAQRAHGIERAATFAIDGKQWQPFDPNDVSWMDLGRVSH